MADRAEFSVVEFFDDGPCEYVRRNVSAEEAINAAKHYCSSVGAKIGTTCRITVTDRGGRIVFEWKWPGPNKAPGDGVVFPTREMCAAILADKEGA